MLMIPVITAIQMKGTSTSPKPYTIVSISDPVHEMFLFGLSHSRAGHVKNKKRTLKTHSTYVNLRAVLDLDQC